MNKRPVILVTPSTEREGAEFADASISLSNRYTDAIIASGGLPIIFPATTNREVIADCVRRADGVVMSGGDDIDPKYYAKNLSAELAKKVGPIEPERDIWEKELIEEVFAQKKPMLGICRGIQMLNVVLGGTLIVDIATQIENGLNHRQMDKKTEPVHEVAVEPDSILAKLTGETKLGVNSTHHQAIGELAPKLRAVAKSSDGIVEAVELTEPANNPFLLAVQFHPERLIDKTPVFRQLFNGFVEACARGREK
jgi:putative glutamine amidotransferase